MQNKLKLALLAAISLLMFSCGDTGNNTPENPIDYFSVKSGDYLIFNGYDLDENNQEKYQGIDSVAVGEAMTWNGRQANELTSYSFNAKTNTFSKSGSLHQSSTKEQVYFSGNFISATLVNLLDFPSADVKDVVNSIDASWIKIVDLSKDSFSILPKNLEITDIPMPSDIFGGLPVDPGKITLNISYNADVIRQPNEKFADKMSNKTLNAVSTKISHKMKIKVKFEKPIFGLTELPLKDDNIKCDQYITFAEGIGLAKLHFPNQTIKLTAAVMGTELDVLNTTIEGFGVKLIRYKKVK